MVKDVIFQVDNWLGLELIIRIEILLNGRIF